MSFVFFLVVLVLAAVTFFTTFFTVSQQTVRIVERFGKFARVARPGLNFKIPWIERLSSEFDMRLRQLPIVTETKTLDNVFVKVTASVQFEVRSDRVYEAFYRLTDPEQQISSYVFDSVRSQIPVLSLDDVFSQKDSIADSIKLAVSEPLALFGYDVVRVLVTDIAPDAGVVQSMNEINAAVRMREAAKEKAEAEKILVVKKAEAEAESMALQGEGTARQRAAIVEGLRDSVSTTAQALGVAESDVMAMVMMTQYLDTLREVGAGSNTLMIPSSPAGVSGMFTEMTAALIASK